MNGTEKKVQLNVRIDEETFSKLKQIVSYYQEETKIGRVYQVDVLTELIDKSFKQIKKERKKKKSQG
ncbi:hypothetical protein [Bacillus sp. 2205SS5-2]|uniref:hypothetical protein n=1 Tax=Bacillus sp. 2205SS5-2 TaxID=3109031 RepID=UPI0030040D0B